jgi:hypothetical protein
VLYDVAHFVWIEAEGHSLKLWDQLTSLYLSEAATI